MPRPSRVAVPPPPARLSPNQRIGFVLAARRGWTGSEWSCLATLWTHESQWNERADNPTSTAYGIAQFLDATWTDYGPKTSDPQRQITYGLAYVSDRYRTPCRAWAAWSSRKQAGNAWY